MSKSLNSAGLSRRQNEVMFFVSRGMRPKAIARDLKLSVRTVEHYIDLIMKKVNVNNRDDLLRWYYDD